MVSYSKLRITLKEIANLYYISNFCVWSLSLSERFNKKKTFHRCHANWVIGFSLFFIVTQMAGLSQTSTGLSVYVYGGLYRVLTLPATVSKTNSAMFLPSIPANLSEIGTPV